MASSTLNSRGPSKSTTTTRTLKLPSAPIPAGRSSIGIPRLVCSWRIYRNERDFNPTEKRGTSAVRPSRHIQSCRPYLGPADFVLRFLRPMEQEVEHEPVEGTRGELHGPAPFAHRVHRRPGSRSRRLGGYLSGGVDPAGRGGREGSRDRGSAALVPRRRQEPHPALLEGAARRPGTRRLQDRGARGNGVRRARGGDRGPPRPATSARPLHGSAPRSRPGPPEDDVRPGPLDRGDRAHPQAIPQRRHGQPQPPPPRAERLRREAVQAGRERRMSRLEELLLKFQDGSLGPEEVRELSALLERPETRAAVVEDFFLTSAIRSHLRAAPVRRVASRRFVRTRRSVSPLPSGTWAWAAAPLLAAMFVVLLSSSRDEAPRPVTRMLP